MLHITISTDDLAQRTSIEDELERSRNRPLRHTPPKVMSLREREKVRERGGRGGEGERVCQ